MKTIQELEAELIKVANEYQALMEIKSRTKPQQKRLIKIRNHAVDLHWQLTLLIHQAKSNKNN